MQEAKQKKLHSQYSIILMQPEGYVHSAAFSEMIETLLHAFSALNLSFRFYINEIDKDIPSIILGAHLLDAASMQDLPDNVIIYNTEQFDEASNWINNDYVALLKAHEVWDFSSENVARLQAMGISRVQYVPVAYVPELTRIPKHEQEDIDVLFYGGQNERRKKILEALIHKGLTVKYVDRTYREERDLLISRAKVVLNMHFYEKSVFESVRVSWLLANEKAVVCEQSPDETLPLPYPGAVCAVPYEGLVDACCELVQNVEKRKALEKQGFAIFSAYSALPVFQKVLHLPVAPQTTPSKLPKILCIGSGKDFRIEAFNLDINEETRPDAVADIASPALFDIPLDTIRFGKVFLQEDSFDELIADDVLEHIVDLKTAMENALRLLKPGGLFHISVPHDLSYGAWQDPTHVRAFNEVSWAYYSANLAFSYLAWEKAAFDVVFFRCIPSKRGQALIAQGKTIEDLLIIPRAISHMKVTLRKRYLQDSEKVTTHLARPWDKAEAN